MHNDNMDDDGNEYGDDIVWLISELKLLPSCSSTPERLRPKENQGNVLTTKDGYT